MTRLLLTALDWILLGGPSVREYRLNPHLWWGAVLSFWAGIAAAVALAALGYNDIAGYAFLIVMIGGLGAVFISAVLRPHK